MAVAEGSRPRRMPPERMHLMLGTLVRRAVPLSDRPARRGEAHSFPGVAHDLMLEPG